MLILLHLPFGLLTEIRSLPKSRLDEGDKEEDRQTLVMF